ncbi:hypothetical protein HELRODRAFT_161432 [Helobdella robusta]|uniref:Fibrous sheath-interacting protein 2 n=1 Tax=Helobdella robusta TaxID=6412 RepID=T1ERG8_HELRO|nr:hypothetical protein HELRODRAFT_161432 [Helobdella robusta]ESO02191.1 hypothetical protein HELRODRAFT_161432 [Helobdella robusta]
MTSGNSKKMCQFDGVPPYYLPKWRYLSLDNKLPVRKSVLDGVLNLYLGDGNIGTSPWIKNKHLDFNLLDPLMLQQPCDREYDSLRDPYLKCYFANARHLRQLYKQGLITREGKTISCLREYNMYRAYIHATNLDIIRTLHVQNECEDTKRLVMTTLMKAKALPKEDYENQCGNNTLYRRYSDALRMEIKDICERAENEFETTPFFREYCEGERQSLLKFRQMLLNDIKKKALIRLQKLQQYEHNQTKFWKHWQKHTNSQVQNRADELVREHVLKYERCKNIKEYMDLSLYRQRKMGDVVQKGKEQHENKLKKSMRKVGQRVCLKSQRQYPLSATCPYS